MKVVVHDWFRSGEQECRNDWGAEFDVELGEGVILERYNRNEIDPLDLLDRIPGEVVLDVTDRKDLRGMQKILQTLVDEGADLTRLTVLSDSLSYRHFALYGTSPLSLNHFGFPVSKAYEAEDIGPLSNIIWVPGIEDIRRLAEVLKNLTSKVKVFYLLDENLPRKSKSIIDQFFNDTLVFDSLGLMAPIPICDLGIAEIIACH